MDFIFIFWIQDIDATQTIAIRLPADSFITGQYIAKFKIGKDFKGIDTPDGCHVIHVESHAELVRLTNPNDIDYTLLFTTFFRGEEIHLADVKYDSERGHLKINNYWTVAERSIENRCDVSVTPKRLEPKDFMKIELNEKHFEGLDPNLILSNLVSFRLNDGPFCKIGFNRNKLAFVSYDI